jgi:hypothetical protein
MLNLPCNGGHLALQEKEIWVKTLRGLKSIYLIEQKIYLNHQDE